MEFSAWIMLTVGAVVLWGGLIFFLWNAYRSGKVKQKK
ncbi:MetS family NSS transporter small subunit [Kroppenstedtia pulmonis]|uniref:MetS family NSS transporter small subunit n=1 Tax=Kroppenstedtia pulmonis TaxID=1380685 RepID=A0A7D4C5D8_9BACL|nr:MetS family NSS transporter small subunit [Kroppenstedtia pulmonis]QKG83716.1 MetS family NSS transporter small subunit [Kroppenstedtia pulmonis]